MSAERRLKRLGGALSVVLSALALFLAGWAFRAASEGHDADAMLLFAGTTFVLAEIVMIYRAAFIIDKIWLVDRHGNKVGIAYDPAEIRSALAETVGRRKVS